MEPTPDPRQVISAIRGSVAAILRLRTKNGRPAAAGAPSTIEMDGSFGSAFCVVRNRYLVTAHHTLNGGQRRDPGDRFYALVVPGNGDVAHTFPVVSFPVERPELDVAVLEIGSCATAGVELPAVPVAFAPRRDGTRVITVGFPSPEIQGLSVDPEGNYRGGQFFLKSHASQGIVSAQYGIGGVPVYEVDVGWHHGESGGPIAGLDDGAAVIALMQHYRNIQSPHGVVAGPHRGISLAAIRPELETLGVRGV